MASHEAPEQAEVIGGIAGGSSDQAKTSESFRPHRMTVAAPPIVSSGEWSTAYAKPFLESATSSGSIDWEGPWP